MKVEVKGPVSGADIAAARKHYAKALRKSLQRTRFPEDGSEQSHIEGALMIMAGTLTAHLAVFYELMTEVFQAPPSEASRLVLQANEQVLAALEGRPSRVPEMGPEGR